MASQYYPVILKLGSRSIEAGFAGDAYPIIRTTTTSFDLSDLDMYQSVTHSFNAQGFRFHDENVLWNYDLLEWDSALLENVLERIIYDIYRNELLTDAKKCKVLVIEPPLLPIPLKEILTKVLLLHIHAQSIRFVSEPVMSCVGAGSRSGLVIDLGWNYITVTPVYDLRMIYKGIRTSNRSGALLHKRMMEKLENVESLANSLCFEFVERLLCEVCYCLPGIRNETPVTDFFEFDGHKIPNQLRHEVIEEVFFSPEESYVADDENQLISTIIPELVDFLEIDLRSELASRIIITGGLSNIPGLKTRILREARSRIHSRTNLHVDSILSLGPFEGASLYCSASLMTARGIRQGELARDKYLSGGVTVSDWTESLYTERVREKTRENSKR